MGAESEIEVEVRVDRKEPGLPAFVVVPAERVAPWGLEGTTTVRAEVAGRDAGRRSLKPWDENRWFVELTAAFLEEADLTVGDRARLVLRRASTELPEELRTLLEDDVEARAAWKDATDARRRQIREHVLDGKRSATRARRARKMLGLE